MAANDLYDEDNPGNSNYDCDVAAIGRATFNAGQNIDAQGSIVRINGATDLRNNEYYL